MHFWKTAALAGALVTAAGVGAAIAPVARGQSARVVAPRGVDAWTFFGGRIGVTVSDIDAADKAGPTNGVLVDSVEEGSPAEKAGLRKGDIIVEFDGERVRSTRQFTRLVSETAAGRTVAAAVQRAGQRVTVNVAPRESDGLRVFEGDSWRRLEEMQQVFPKVTPAPKVFEMLSPGSRQLGVTITELSPQLAEYFGVKEGVLVSAVRDDSAAAKAGVNAGDVVTTFNGAEVTSASEFRRRMSRVEPGEEFSIGVMRERKPLTLKGKTEAPVSRRSTSRSIV